MSKLREAFRFMLENAGYSTPPGRAVCAIDLARAELRASEEGYRFEWSDDLDARTTATDEQYERLSKGETAYLEVLVRDPHGNVVGALGGVEVLNWDDPYLRVCEAELAYEAISDAEREHSERVHWANQDLATV